MSRATSPSALKPCCEAYGTWVSRLRLAYSQRAKLARRMNAAGSSSWPTATAHSFAQTIDNPTPGQTGGKTLAGAAELMWTTPQAHDVTARGSGQKPSAKAGNACLATDAQNWTTPSDSDHKRGGTLTEAMTGTSLVQQVNTLWGTPRASDAEKGGPNQAFGSGGKPLPAQAAQWPTPASRDYKGENGPDHLINGTGRLHMDQLPNMVAHGFTLPDPAPMMHGPTLSQLRPIWRQLRASLIASHGRAVWLRLWTGRTKKRLNPLFVEWLMGWPPGHALCDCSETEWHRWQQHMRGALSRLPTASGPWIWSPQKPTPPPMIQGNLFGD